MTPIFSVLHATWGRPAKAVEAMRMTLDRANMPDRIEYIFACNEDDKTHAQLLMEIAKVHSDLKIMPLFVTGLFNGSAPAWDAAAKISTGQILLQMSDDLELPLNFDSLIPEECAHQCGAWWNHRPSYIAVSDGFRKDSLCTCAVMNRKYYELSGHFIPPEYQSVHSDGEVTFRAKQRSVKGDAVWIDAKNITLLHRHHYNDHSVPWDEVYDRGNSQQAYETGLKLLTQRNPGIASSPLVDWL